MRYSHYNKHLKKGNRLPVSLTFILLMLVSVFYSERSGKFNHIYISTPMQVTIPKSSMLVAALKDQQVAEFHVDLNEFREMGELRAEKLESDKNYKRPKVINLKEGLSLNKADYILGKVKYIDPKNGALRLSKAEARSYIDESQEDQAVEDFSAWYQMVEREEKNRLIYNIASSSNPAMFNRLNELDYKDLKSIEDLKEPTKDPVLEEIKNKIDNFQFGVNTSNIQIAANTPSSKGTSYAWSQELKKRARGVNAKQDSSSENSDRPGKAKELAGDLSSMLSSLGGVSSSVSKSKLENSSGYKAESLDVVMPVENENRAHRIEGSIELVDGLAFLGPGYTLGVKFFSEAGKEIKAELDLATATFFVDIEGWAGTLVAEYKDSSGRLLGSFEKHISGVVERIHAKIRPENWGLKLNLIGPLKDAIADLWIDGLSIDSIEDAVYINEAWTSYSNFLISYQARGQVRENRFVRANTDIQIEPTSLNYKEELLNSLKDQGVYVDPNLGVVIGSIQKGSSPLNFNAEITDSNAIGPIYLNDFMVPDVSLEKSSYSGLFLFVNVRPDIHQVRVLGEELAVSQVVSVEYSTISHVDYNLDHRKSLRLSVRDLQTGDKLVTNFQISGTEDLFQSEDLETVQYTFLKDKAFHNLEFWSGMEYLPTRWSFNDRKDYRYAKNLFVVKKSLLDKVFDTSKPILQLQMKNPIKGFLIDHKSALNQQLKIYGLNPDAGLQTYEEENIESYSDIFISGLDEGLHSVQVLLPSGLMSNNLVSLGLGTLSIIEP